MLKEFKKFISKGNVLDMAVGLILATYFGAIVKSLVNDILMPPIGMILGGVDFKKLKFIVQEQIPESMEGAADGIPEIAIYYGSFINHVITFFIVSTSIFLVVRLYNNMKEKVKRKEEETPTAPPAPSKEEVLLTEIRDLLKK